MKDAAGNAITVTDGKFTMPAAAVTVSATFKKISYTITVTEITGGSVSVKNAAGEAITTAQMDDVISVSYEATTGWEFVELSVKDALGNAITVTDGKFTMPAENVGISATFKKITYTVTIASGITGGTVTADKTTAQMGDEVTLTVTPAAGYQLKTLSVKNGETEIEVKDNKFTMPAGNVTVSATFSNTDFTVAIATDIANGSVSTDKKAATLGETVTITATPAAGYELDALSVKDPISPLPQVRASGNFSPPLGITPSIALFARSMSAAAAVR